MRGAALTIDAGIADAVVALNRIPGVTTRASCEGMSRDGGAHRHAALAYVALRFPMPLRLQDFLYRRLAGAARIEDDGVYSRWPSTNRSFAEQLCAAADAYRQQAAAATDGVVRWQLPRLRARLARQTARGTAAQVALCLDCRDIVTAPHVPAHRSVSVARLPAQQRTLWFAEFARTAGNALDPALVAAEGWAKVLARTQADEFGAAFKRRWLRYRARCVAQLSTRELRSGVAQARRAGLDVDLSYDATQVVFSWRSP